MPRQVAARAALNVIAPHLAIADLRFDEGHMTKQSDGTLGAAAHTLASIEELEARESLPPARVQTLRERTAWIIGGDTAARVVG